MTCLGAGMLNKLFQISRILLEIKFENSGKTHIMFCSEEERKEKKYEIDFLIVKKKKICL
ncbi:hypothetical protein IMSAGC002_01995 [Lachnospiraceae bacterium]|nr:hypothetical protein IMSAGC002_01995 [Lachnospiraceae bacterium]